MTLIYLKIQKERINKIAFWNHIGKHSTPNRNSAYWLQIRKVKFQQTLTLSFKDPEFII